MWTEEKSRFKYQLINNCVECVLEEMVMSKKLYRSNERKIFGVCGGIAEYFNIDPTIVRLIWIIFACSGGSGAIFYLIAAVLMENRPDYVSRYDEDNK